jgi:acyl-CoA hydrolase/GNAT superfamily N-acetyltransferase
MSMSASPEWRKKITTPLAALKKIKPGMNIFIGTGAAEPRTLVKKLMTSKAGNLQDLTLIQMVSLGDAISLEVLNTQKYRLKTVFTGWAASDAIQEGRVDLIPCHLSKVPGMITSGRIAVDAAFIQVTPPDGSGYMGLGIGVDVARQVMERARVVIGEINEHVPRTLGDTTVHTEEFTHLIESDQTLFYTKRWDYTEVYDRLAANVASVVENGTCLGFSIGPLYEALGKHLRSKRELGIHSPYITDALMELIESGAVSNRKKDAFRGRSLVCYALGSQGLMYWLDHNPLVEFQSLDRVFDPRRIGRNDNFMGVFPARRVDLSGRIALHQGRGTIATDPAEIMDFFTGASLSRGGRTVFALPSRNSKGGSNLLPSIEKYPNQFNQRESVDLVVTDFGVANLAGCTLRERAQALIDIAHPDDRADLLERARLMNIVYKDQVQIHESVNLYPTDLEQDFTMKDGRLLRVRAIRPSDEEGMRNLFYRFSEDSIYYRYFSPIKTMPHAKMQEYVNVDYSKALSIVGLVGPAGQGTIVAEARYVMLDDGKRADAAFIVDEAYQGKGVATFMFNLLIKAAKERGIQGFIADVLASNRAMMAVFEKGGYPVQAHLEQGEYHLSITFDDALDG